MSIDNFSLHAASVCVGENIVFSFQIEAKKEIKVRLEYAIDYVKSNGLRSRKVFKISEPLLGKNKKNFYTKTHSLANTSSRKYFPGIYSVTLIVNGIERGTFDFKVFGSLSS